MGSEYTFYDYVDRGKVNSIRRWLDSIPEAAKQKLNRRLFHLEGTRRWLRPLVDALTDGDCAGLFEIRANLSGRQYRILGCHGLGQGAPTLLHTFIKPGNRVPESECREAHRKRTEIGANITESRMVHDYG